MRKKLAEMTSNLLNPFLVGLAIIVLITLDSASSVTDALKWIVISLGLTFVPVLGVMLYLVYSDRIEGISIRMRQQRDKIYLLSCACGVISCIVLFSMGAPLVLIASFVAGLCAIVIFMCINLWWKISVHTALVGGSVTMLIVLYGFTGAISAVLLPAVTWSRIELKHHSLAQVGAGALLSAAIVAVVFLLFGLVGRVSPV